MAFVRGSSVKFIILPDILSKAPFFNRIKLWRKFKGHAVFGINTVTTPRGPRGAAMTPRGIGRGIVASQIIVPRPMALMPPQLPPFPRPMPPPGYLQQPPPGYGR